MVIKLFCLKFCTLFSYRNKDVIERSKTH